MTALDPGTRAPEPAAEPPRVRRPNPVTPGSPAPGGPRALEGAQTLRKDAWRRAPLTVAAILGFFVVYTLIRIFMNSYYFVGESAGQFHYLTPVYSPCISASCVEGSSDFGHWLPEFPTGIPLAILIFPILAGFRGTCYYYRKAGWRSLWLSPQACAVPEPHKKYTGESRFPLTILNWHRFFFTGASILLLVNFYDAAKAFTKPEGGIRIGLGSIIMLVNVVMLALYSLSCHACRHAVGGRINHFGKHPIRYRMWTFVSRINPKHGTYAMISLFTVILTDAYIMVLSMIAENHALPGWL
jgi:hypothetical protein